MKHLFFIICIVFSSVVSYGQDYQFTQFFSAPLVVNPANTGRFKEDIRATINHRRQWSALNSEFITSAFGADLNFKSRWLKKDKIGAGIMLFQDNLAAGTIRTSAIYASGAYHRMLDLQRRHRLSLGIQLGYSQKSYNLTNLQFSNQYKDFLYNSSLPSLENIDNDRSAYFDGQIGAFYNFILSDKTDFIAGLSFYQLQQPKESLYNNVGNKIGTRGVYNIGVNQRLGSKLILSPQALYMRQSSAYMLNMGAILTYELNAAINTQLIGGLFMRAKDAAIFVVGARYKSIDCRFSYDATASSLKNAKGAEGTVARPVGAYEFSLNYFGLLRRNHPSDFTVPCGIF